MLTIEPVDARLETYRRINTFHGGIEYKNKENLIIPITNTIIYPQVVMILHHIYQSNKMVKINPYFRNSNVKLKLKVTSIDETQLTYHFQNTPSANLTMIGPARLVCKALVIFLLLCILQQVNRGTQW